MTQFQLNNSKFLKIWQSLQAPIYKAENWQKRYYTGFKWVFGVIYGFLGHKASFLLACAIGVKEESFKCETNDSLFLTVSSIDHESGVVQNIMYKITASITFNQMRMEIFYKVYCSCYGALFHLDALQLLWCFGLLCWKCWNVKTGLTWPHIWLHLGFAFISFKCQQDLVFEVAFNFNLFKFLLWYFNVFS